MRSVAGKPNGRRFEGMRRVAVELNRQRLALNDASSTTLWASSATVWASSATAKLNRDGGSSTATVGLKLNRNGLALCFFLFWLKYGRCVLTLWNRNSFVPMSYGNFSFCSTKKCHSELYKSFFFYLFIFFLFLVMRCDLVILFVYFICLNSKNFRVFFYQNMLWREFVALLKKKTLKNFGGYAGYWNWALKSLVTNSSFVTKDWALWRFLETKFIFRH